MKILYLTYHGLSEHSGISKKMLAQVKGLRENGHEVFLCTYIIDKEGQRKRMMNDVCIENYGKGVLAKIKKRCCYGSIVRFAKEQGIEFAYIRSFHNANSFTIKLFRELRKVGIRIAMEIPTYPYDQEYEGFSFFTRLGLRIDRQYRERLAALTNGIVTFTDEKSIFGQRTIRISNGVDFDSLPLHHKQNNSPHEIHLIGVAEVHYWHGFDRLIAGMGEFYRTTNSIFKPHFHIVGGVASSEMYGSPHAPGFQELIEKYDLQEYVHFHGPLHGKELDEMFDQCDFAIGSLGRHRSHIDKIKTLKNREYAARGIPFIYSETDEDFDDKPYVLKAPADESPINIEELLDFCLNKKFDPQDIRNTVTHLSWKVQMRKVIDEIYLKP